MIITPKYRGTVSDQAAPQDHYLVPQLGFTSLAGVNKALREVIQYDMTSKGLPMPEVAVVLDVPRNDWVSAHPCRSMAFTI